MGAGQFVDAAGLRRQLPGADFGRSARMETEMNSDNETVVTSEMRKQLRNLALDEGYEPVPDQLRDKAADLLNGQAIASMDEDMKRKLRNLGKRMRQAGVPGY